jgi:hypothetical protein
MPHLSVPPILIDGLGQKGRVTKTIISSFGPLEEEKHHREKQISSLADISSTDIAADQFDTARHFGQFAINVYYASW